MRRPTRLFAVLAAALAVLALSLASCAGLPAGGNLNPEEEIFDAAALDALSAQVSALALQAAGRVSPGTVDGRALQERLRLLRTREDLDRLRRQAVQRLSGEAALSSGDPESARSVLEALSSEAGWSPGSKKADPAPLLRALLLADASRRREALASNVKETDPRVAAELALLDMDALDYKSALSLFDASLPLMGPALRAVYAPLASECQRRAELSAGTGGAAGESGAAQAIIQLSAEAEVSYGELARALFSLRRALFDPALRAQTSPASDALILDLASSGIFPSSAAVGGRPRTGMPHPGAGLPAMAEAVTRREAALIFFTLHQALATRPLASDRYSKRYQTPGLPGFGKSPVPDLAYGSPGFDACLAMVELEVMELPDGRNFSPEGILSGMDAAKALKKLGL